MQALFEAFQARAQAVSAEVHRFAEKAAALDFIAGVVESTAAAGDSPSAVWADQWFLSPGEREAMGKRVAGLTFEVTRAAAAAAPVGITEVEWAIAATGTLAGDFAAAESRLASTLPPIHIALAATASIEPDLPAVLAHLRPEECAYISMITGPSRTADIERVLTIGVHGPKRLIIVFVDELARVE